MTLTKTRVFILMLIVIILTGTKLGSWWSAWRPKIWIAELNTRFPTLHLLHYQGRTICFDRSSVDSVKISISFSRGISVSYFTVNVSSTSTSPSWMSSSSWLSSTPVESEKQRRDDHHLHHHRPHHLECHLHHHECNLPPVKSEKQRRDDHLLHHHRHRAVLPLQVGLLMSSLLSAMWVIFMCSVKYAIVLCSRMTQQNQISIYNISDHLLPAVEVHRAQEGTVMHRFAGFLSVWGECQHVLDIEWTQLVEKITKKIMSITEYHRIPKEIHQN